MSATTTGLAEADAVWATLNYVAPTAERLRTYTYDPPAGEPRSNVVPDPREVPIRDLRPIAEQVSLDEHGFAVLRHRSSVSGYEDEAEIRAVVYPEAARLLREVTGADRVHVFDHTLRRRVPGQEDRRGGQRQPVTRVHVDQTERSGPQRVRDLLPGEADALLRGRVQIINLWRPIRGPVLDAPLAVADARSVRSEDLVPSDLVYPDRTGEIYHVRYNPAHRWFFVRAMQPDEVLLLKCFDSAEDGRARFAPHSAFIDPTAPADAPPRESIELRALVFHHRA
jgi:hypothetical protein